MGPNRNLEAQNGTSSQDSGLPIFLFFCFVVVELFLVGVNSIDGGVHRINIISTYIHTCSCFLCICAYVRYIIYKYIYIYVMVYVSSVCSSFFLVSFGVPTESVQTISLPPPFFAWVRKVGNKGWRLWYVWKYICICVI